MPSIDIDVPSEWEIYRISYLVQKGWKRKEYTQIPEYQLSRRRYYDTNESIEYCWYHPDFINRDVYYGKKQLLITRGKRKGEYKEEDGLIDSLYFTLDQAWDAQEQKDEEG